MLTSDGIRSRFLDFYLEKGFLKIPGATIIPRNDPTLLFVNSGMAPLKPFFSGLVPPPSNRLCNIQLCINTTSIPQVGDSSHLTSFEMMGSWTFGECERARILKNAWELIIEGFHIPREQIVVSYFGGDPAIPGVPIDNKSRRVWQEIGIPDDRIYPLGAGYNFWGPPGDSGMCGPNSEVFIDLGRDKGNKKSEGPDSDTDRFIEIWNPGVFLEYNMSKDGDLSPLEYKCTDAGAGVERWAMILQGRESVYEIDSIAPILDVFTDGNALSSDSKEIRVLTDHMRTATFLVHFGVQPSNKGGGYVLRRLIRTAATYAYLNSVDFSLLLNAAKKVLSVNRGDRFSDGLSDPHLEIIIANELDKFLTCLKQGIKRLENIIKQSSYCLSGEEIFQVKQTYGMPLEVIKHVVSENGCVIDLEEYDNVVDRHRAISKVRP